MSAAPKLADLAALQSACASVVSDAPGPGAVSGHRLHQLDDVRADPGLDVVKMLYRSWRLTKVLSLLPLTTAAIPTDELTGLLGEFWQRRKAVGPYFVEECLAFLDFLTTSGVERSARLVDLAAFERARLELHDEIAAGAQRADRDVVLRHRPSELFSTDAAETCEPADSPSTLRGSVDEQGTERWVVTSGPDDGLSLRVGRPAH